MPDDRFFLIRSPQFQAMSQRVVEVTALTTQLNLLPFDDEAGKAMLLEQILGTATARTGDDLSTVLH